MSVVYVTPENWSVKSTWGVIKGYKDNLSLEFGIISVRHYHCILKIWIMYWKAPPWSKFKLRTGCSNVHTEIFPSSYYILNLKKVWLMLGVQSRCLKLSMIEIYTIFPKLYISLRLSSIFRLGLHAHCLLI